MRVASSLGLLVVATVLTIPLQAARAQGYGSDLQNVFTPAGGGMAGVSIALPQDVAGAIFGNPATLAQFRGTQFEMGGAWAEGYPHISYNDHNGNAFDIRSGTEGSAGPEIGVIQDLQALGLPGAMGMGITSASGGGAEYRGLVPPGGPINGILNETSLELLVLNINMAAGLQMTDRLSVGAAFALGTGIEQLGFLTPTVATAMVHDFGIRGTIGADYELNDCNTVGAFFQTKEHFQFPNSVRVGADWHDARIDQPATIGFGVANRSFLDGNLLLAADVYYKLWEDADLYRDVFVNQWAFAVGSQWKHGHMKYRLGYSYNSSPINHSVGDSLDGVGIGKDAVQLFQAALLPAINQHRITAGIGREDFLIKGLDFDLFAGGMPKATEQFGNTQATVATYYLGMGMTWRYGATCQQNENTAP